LVPESVQDAGVYPANFLYIGELTFIDCPVEVIPCNSNMNAFELGSNILMHFIISPDRQDCLPSISCEQVEAEDPDAKPTKISPAMSNSDLFIAHLLF